KFASGKQATIFFLDFLRRRNGISNSRANDLSKPAANPMDGDGDCLPPRVQVRTCGFIGRVIAFSGKKNFEHLKLPVLARRAEFIAQTRHSGLEESDGPTLFVYLVWSSIVDRLQPVAFFGVCVFKRNDLK